MWLNLPSLGVYRSPQRNRYCRGPILAYWPRKLSMQEFLPKQFNQSVPFSSVPITVSARWTETTSKKEKKKKKKETILSHTKGGDKSQSYVRSSSPSPVRAHQWAELSRLSDTLAVSAVTNSNITTDAQTETSPLPDGSAASTASPPWRLCFTRGSTRGDRSRPSPAWDKLRDERLEMGFSQRWVAVRARCGRSLAPPINSVAQGGKK